MPPIKILHALGTLDPGGVENWLLALLRSLDTKRFQFDFCTFGSHAGLYAPEAEKLGARIIRCPLTKNPITLSRRFRQILREGKYDVVHSHVHLFSGALLRCAGQENIAIRIAHSHTNQDSKSSTLYRHAYRSLMKRWIQHNATHGLAASREAAEALFTANWKNDHRVAILHYGIDLRQFQGDVDSNIWRTKLGLPPGTPIVGHIGNFVTAKNHVFFLGVAAQILKQRPDVHFLMVGDGPLRAQIESLALTMHLQKNVRFLGTRTDVPLLLRACMDAFLFPSLWEGLPVAVIEAQAAGLPCVISDEITDEVCVLPQHIVRLPLSLGPQEWARKTLELLNHGKLDAQAAIQSMQLSDFSIDPSFTILMNLYSGPQSGNRAPSS